MATDGLGRTLYINGSFAEGKNAVYEIGPDFQPILLDSAIQQSLAWPDDIYWSDRLNSFIVFSQDRPGYGGITTRATLLSEDQVYPLGPFNSGLVIDLPHFSTTAVVSSWQLSFMDEHNKLYHVVEFESAGTPGITDLGDDWIYIAHYIADDPDTHDYVIHLTAGPDWHWRANKIIQLEERENGFANAFIRLLLGVDKQYATRYPLTTIIRNKGPGHYSPALHRLFFPRTMEEFVDGNFVPVGKGQYKLKQYIGDVERLHVALFEAEDGQIYSYNGNELKPVKNGKVEPYWIDSERLETGIILDLPTIDKVFYTIRSAAYELGRDNGEFELQKVKLPEEFIPGKSDFFSTKFLVTPIGGDVFILTSGNIYLLSTLEKIYSTDVPLHQINTTGSDQLPMLIPQWNGILFSTGGTYVPGDKEEHYHLLTNCEH